MSLGREAWQEARSAITHLLSKENCALSDNATLRQEILVPMVRRPIGVLYIL